MAHVDPAVIIALISSTFGLLASVVAGYMAIRVARVSEDARLAAIETKQTATEVAKHIEGVHVAVNSERAEMLRKVAGLTAKIAKLTQARAVKSARGRARK